MRGAGLPNSILLFTFLAAAVSASLFLLVR
jgi:hypothetical protein